MKRTDDPRGLKDKPMRVTVEIQDLQNKVSALKASMQDVLHLHDRLDRIEETMEQLHTMIEWLPVPAPVFLRWRDSEEDGRPVYRATFGKYTLEVINGSSAVSWSVNGPRNKVLAIGGGMTHVGMAMDEAEKALQEIVQDAAQKG